MWEVTKAMWFAVTYMKVKIPQFCHVPAHHLVAVTEDDLS